jgi:dolichol-phosphate mannosyltransferase
MLMPKTTIVIPTYNEAANLPAITEKLFDLRIPDLDILIVDDNSPDGTGQVADELALKYNSQLHVMHRAGKQGLGTAYVQGFNWALDHGANYVVQMDADFSHSPSYIPEFLRSIADYDVVVGSRYVKGGRLDEHWGWWRWLLSWWANSVWVRLLLGVKTKDATAGYKCWRADALRAIHLEDIRSNGYIFQVEMCYMADRLGLRVHEIPIYFEDRQIGKSKMSPIIQIEAALGVFAIRLRHQGRKLLKP